MSALWRRAYRWVAASAVAAGLTAAPAVATVGGTNGRIALVRTGAPSLLVESVAADGTGITGPLSSGLYPAWSPDGARIAYSATAAGVSQNFVMDGDGGHPTQLTHETPASRASDPAWSPDGRRIAFTRATPSGSQIAVINADGSGETALTPAATASDARANWSPGGTRIAFDSTRSGPQEVWVMNADGSSPTQLTTDPEGAFSAWPNWSPDGLRIAFESNRDKLSRNNFANGAEIYVMLADGSGPVRLTHDAASDERPSWAPDGTRLAYSHVTLAPTARSPGCRCS
jgi:TolB protein